MKKLRTLLVVFENEIPPGRITAFRGAVIEKVGREHTLFHNHLGKDIFSYKYPLIQYKTIDRKPAIFCVGQGVDVIHQLFGKRNWTIDLQGEKIDLKVGRVDLKSTNLGVWQKKFSYNIWNWQALNEKNWEQYRNLESLSDKTSILTRILKGNILSFAKGVEWKVEDQIDVVIRDIKMEKNARMKDVHVKTFSMDFVTNVYLPDFMGLGKGASSGFGIIRKKQEQKNTGKWNGN